MKTELVRIGNSRGIRIPKPLIEQCGLGEVVDLRAERGRLIISPQHRPRQGWGEAFRAAGSATSDELVIDNVPPNEFDSKEWRW